ncbi:pyridoxine 5'-phosphate synthase [Saccharophagus degradans]|uniref:Pyridoxine 5'-phosphate synthase n=1 Tax=Saccharophagus degradans (strain 2-40 / ATCC 43961 / DSM 17024) TaxID=203122 RepID=Q21K06_SACD2|nr:pyridoxine 5'-phosphate synthase [Saccharophagus degradans]ABD80973.1 Pyridoxal phosphate biosynthetic protein PdxJ [Saccharophagus degradans 2-40]
MAIDLSVNLNKIALIRNSREGNYPDVTAFGRLSLDAGAAGLTVHPRPDQRHITPDDVRNLAALRTEYPRTEFNIEGNPFAPARGTYPGLIELVAETNPEQCTLVPDNDAQKTSDHGFDLKTDGERLIPLIEKLHSLGARVSLFMDPDPEQIALAKQIGADRIELYTGPYAWAFGRNKEEGEQQFLLHKAAAEAALLCGLGINAGHDLNLQNLPLYSQLPGLQEVSIGHALTVDALLMGYSEAVAAYRAICD